MPSTPAGEIVLVHCPQFMPFKEHTSIGGTVNTCEHIEQSRLPTSGWPINREEALGRDGKGDII